MNVKEPTSIDECVYFTQRIIGEGKAKAWVYKEKCPKCGNSLMGKPRNERGKIKIRAKEYQCPECKYKAEKEEYESTLTAQVRYTCPHCKCDGGAELPFKRKKVQRINEETGKKETVEVLRVECDKCKANIDITKKMK